MAEILLVKETIYKEEVDLILQGKNKEEVLEYMDNKQAAQNAKDEERKKQQEVYNQLQDLEQKVKTAEFYYKNGKISKQDYDKLLEAKQDMEDQIKNLNAPKQEKTTEQADETAVEKSEQEKMETPQESAPEKPKRGRKPKTENTETKEEKPKTKKVKKENKDEEN